MIFLGCVAGMAIGMLIVLALQLGDFWGFNLLLESIENGRLLYAALAWLGSGLLAGLLWSFFYNLIRDFYPALPKEKHSINLIYATALGLIYWLIIFIYIRDIRKSVRGDSDENGGNFIKISPALPSNPKSKTKSPSK